MSHTKKGSKGPGYEYDNLRQKEDCPKPGKKTKILTHQRERAIAKREVRKETP